MVLNSSFEKFLDRIKLDDTRAGKIQAAHNTLRDYLAEDDEIKPRFYESFLQGSYRLNTAVRPQGDGEYDVDVILSLNLKKDDGTMMVAKDVIEWVANRLKLSDRYKEKVKPRRRCVRVNYAQGLHMDITPAHCDGNTDGVLLVPPDWSESHPKGFREWCIKCQENSANFFYPAVKMLKWWRNIHYGDDGSPKSMIFTTMAGLHIPAKSNSYDEALVTTMESINIFLQLNPSVPTIKNPSLETEILSSRWSLSDYWKFRDDLNSATKQARRALDEKDEEKTIEIWNSLVLYSDTFPKSKKQLEEEARKMAEAMQNGKLGVTSSGQIGLGISSGATRVSPTKFFGGNEES